jgi:hypothetical protein
MERGFTNGVSPATYNANRCGQAKERRKESVTHHMDTEAHWEEPHTGELINVSSFMSTLSSSTLTTCINTALHQKTKSARAQST